ncbi:MAG: hypothetical protein AABW83_00420 [Nanoarchaeota archaeon]
MKKRFLRYFFWLILIVFIFTIIDLVLHYSIEYLEIYYYPIPNFLKFISDSPTIWYGIGKFLGSFIIGILCYPLLIKIKYNLNKSLTLTVITVLLLEARYILSGYYTISWDLFNAINHFIVLFICSYFIFSKFKIFDSKNKN